VKKESNEETDLQKIGRHVMEMCSTLIAAPSIDVKQLRDNEVPTEIGLYLWRSKIDGRPAYIGVALGRRGLRGRIMKQHLQPSYRKSVLRKTIAECKGLDLGVDCVEFLRDNFTVSYVACSSIKHSWVQAAESLLIAALGPQYNRGRNSGTLLKVSK